MLSASRGEMGEQGVGHFDAAVTQVAGSAVEMDGIPQDDGGNDKTAAGGLVPLVLEGAVTQFPEPVEEDDAGECVAGLSLVKNCVGTPAQMAIVEPVKHKQGVLEPPNFMQGAGNAVLARIAGQPAQHHRYAEGAGPDLRGEPQWLVPVLLDGAHVDRLGDVRIRGSRP